MQLGGQHAIFLDCLTLPRGLINRKFVFASLTSADHILLIETPHYCESVWCRKERWVAEAMEKSGLARVSRIPLEDAASFIASPRHPARARSTNKASQYPISGRILKDNDNWGRQPNKYGLAEKKISVEFLSSIEQFLETRLPEDGSTRPTGAAQAVSKLIDALVAAALGPDPIDSWSTALQYVVATFGLDACAQSKMDVRRGIDQMNAALGQLVSSGIIADPVFRQNLTAYMSFVGAAVVLDLAGFVVTRKIGSRNPDGGSAGGGAQRRRPPA